VKTYSRLSDARTCTCDDQIKVGDVVTYKEACFPQWSYKIFFEVTEILHSSRFGPEALFHGKIIRNEVGDNSPVAKYRIGELWLHGTLGFVHKVVMTKSGKVSINV